MAKQTKVLFISGTYCDLVCYRNNQEKYNPYLLYVVYPDKDKYGYPTVHRAKLVKYDDMTSILYHVKDLFQAGFMSMTKDNVIAWNRGYCN